MKGNDILNAMIGEKLKSIREKNHYSLADVGNRLGITRNGYHHYERGRRSIPLDMLEKFCDIFNVSYLDVLGEVQDEYIAYLENNKDNIEVWFDGGR